MDLEDLLIKSDYLGSFQHYVLLANYKLLQTLNVTNKWIRWLNLGLKITWSSFLSNALIEKVKFTLFYASIYFPIFFCEKHHCI